MKNKKILIIVGVIFISILALVAVCGIIYLKTDVLKTDKQLFGKYINKINIENENFLDAIECANENKKKMNYSNTDIKISAPILNFVENIPDIEDSIIIKSIALKNKPMKQEYREIKILDGNKEYFNIKYIKDENIYGVLIDNILNKYLAIENANLKEFCSKFNIDSSEIPDSIQINLKEAFDKNKDNLKEIKEKYIDYIYKNINNEKFYQNQNDDGSKIIGVMLTERDITDLIYELLEQVKNDKTTLQIIIDNLKETKLDSDISIEKIQELLQATLDEMTANESSTDEYAIKISMQIKKGNITKINFEKTSKIVQLENQSEILGVNNKLCIDLNEQNKIIISIFENNEELNKMAFEYYYDDNTIDFKLINLKNNEQENIKILEYQITGYKTNNIKVKMNSEVFFMGTQKIEYNNSMELKQDVTIDKLTSDNSVKLNDMTAERITEVFTTLLNKINYMIIRSDDTIIKNEDTNNRTLLQNVNISGYTRMNSNIDFYINGETYVSNNQMLEKLVDYKDYIKLDIYYNYTEKEEKAIVDYKAVLKSNNEDISNIKTEEELRTKIGLYNSGTYTNSFTFLKKSAGASQGVGKNQIYYLVYVFADDKNNEYKMRYLCKEEEYENMYMEDKFGLIANNKYNVTFEVVKDETWDDYKYYIKVVD